MALVLLDRDGVINEFPGVGAYVTSWEMVRFVPKAKEALALLTRAGYDTAVISNQGCVARGMITREGLDALTGRMMGEIEAAGGKLGSAFYCVHQTSDVCECKKPKTGLFHEAMRGRPENPASVYFIGDSEEDMAAGKAFGCRTILVLSGRTRSEDVEKLKTPPDAVKKDLWDAANWIIARAS